MRFSRWGWVMVVGVALCGSCSKNNDISATTNNNYTTINNITQVVGPEGAHVGTPDTAQVDIPPGALTQNVTIKLGEITQGGPSVPAGATRVSAVWAIEPHGQTFARDVVVTLPHTAGSTKVDMLRAEVDGAFASVQTSDVTSNTVAAKTTSFSFFAAVEGSGSGSGGTGGVAGAGGTAGTSAGGMSGTGGTGAAGTGGGAATGGTAGTGGGAATGGTAGTGGGAATGGTGGAAGTGGGAGCPAGFWDLDESPLTGTLGCEYACSKTSSLDPIDGSFVDENCDGSDGVVAACVYVSPSLGSDGAATGTRGAPFQTIAAAIQFAKANSVPAVCLAGEVFNDAVVLESGVSLFGGFDANDSDFMFRRSAAATTTLNAPGTVILATQIDSETHVAGLTIHAETPGGMNGESTYGVRLVAGSGPLFVEWNTLTIDPGQDGADGTDATGTTGCVGVTGLKGLGGQGGGGSFGVFAAGGVLHVENNSITTASGGQGGVGGDGGTAQTGCGSPMNGTAGPAGAGTGTISGGSYAPARAGDGTEGTTGGVGGPGGGGGGGPSACVATSSAITPIMSANSCSPASPGAGGGGGTNSAGALGNTGDPGIAGPNLSLAP